MQGLMDCHFPQSSGFKWGIVDMRYPKTLQSNILCVCVSPESYAPACLYTSDVV